MTNHTSRNSKPSRNSEQSSRGSCSKSNRYHCPNWEIIHDHPLYERHNDSVGYTETTVSYNPKLHATRHSNKLDHNTLPSFKDSHSQRDSVDVVSPIRYNGYHKQYRVSPYNQSFGSPYNSNDLRRVLRNEQKNHLNYQDQYRYSHHPHSKDMNSFIRVPYRDHPIDSSHESYKRHWRRRDRRSRRPSPPSRYGDSSYYLTALSRQPPSNCYKDNLYNMTSLSHERRHSLSSHSRILSYRYKSSLNRCKPSSNYYFNHRSFSSRSRSPSYCHRSFSQYSPSFYAYRLHRKHDLTNSNCYKKQSSQQCPFDNRKYPRDRSTTSYGPPYRYSSHDTKRLVHEKNFKYCHHIQKEKQYKDTTTSLCKTPRHTGLPYESTSNHKIKYTSSSDHYDHQQFYPYLSYPEKTQTRLQRKRYTTHGSRNIRDASLRHYHRYKSPLTLTDSRKMEHSRTRSINHHWNQYRHYDNTESYRHRCSSQDHHEPLISDHITSTELKKNKAQRKDDEIIHFDWYQGMKLSKRFIVISQLGEGTFGRVLECKDLRYGRTVAVKVVRDISRYTTAAKIEAGILEEIRHCDPEGKSNCVILLDRFLYDVKKRRPCRTSSARRRHHQHQRSISRSFNKRQSIENHTLGRHVPCSSIVSVDQHISSRSNMIRQNEGHSREDDHYGDGIHMCLVSEKLGLSLFAFLSQNKYRGFFIADIQKITYEVLKALAFLQKIQLTHTDLKPENILFVNNRVERVPFLRSKYPTRFWDGDASDSEASTDPLPELNRTIHDGNDPYANQFSPLNKSHSIDDKNTNHLTHYLSPACNQLSDNSIQPLTTVHNTNKFETVIKRHSKPSTMTKRPIDCHVKLIDFGSATFDDDDHCNLINTRQYRAPEVILRWSTSSDIWCLGCILIELYTGVLLFRTHEHLEHLALMEKILEPFPQTILHAASLTDGAKYLLPHRKLPDLRLNWPQGASSQRSIDKVSRCRKLEDMVLPCHRLFAEFLRFLLAVDPSKRPTPTQAMQHPFLQKTLSED